MPEKPSFEDALHAVTRVVRKLIDMLTRYEEFRRTRDRQLWRRVHRLRSEIRGAEEVERALDALNTHENEFRSCGVNVRELRRILPLVHLQGSITVEHLTPFQEQMARAAAYRITLTEDDLQILRAIKKDGATPIQKQIVRATSLSRRTVQDRLLVLESHGLVHRPNGPRQGFALTSQGDSFTLSPASS